ncbi:MAG: hypothetical protein P8I61_06060 [Opitutae bacterium]|nr:hypothetical protein [Opitutae bacterium]
MIELHRDKGSVWWRHSTNEEVCLHRGQARDRDATETGLGMGLRQGQAF